MYTIGYIDDNKEIYEDNKVKLKRYDIDLKYCENCIEKEDILDWIGNNNIKCLLIDYKLRGQFKFTGNELLNFLASELPGLQCIILTSYKSDSINDKNVPSFLVYDKDDLLDDKKVMEMTENIKNCADTFDNVLEEKISEYEILKDKKNKKNISVLEEERLALLYRILRVYGEVDDLPISMLNSKVDEKLDDIIKTMNLLIEK